MTMFLFSPYLVLVLFGALASRLSPQIRDVLAYIAADTKATLIFPADARYQL